MLLPDAPHSHASPVGAGEDALAFDLMEHGFAGPAPLLSSASCAALVQHLSQRNRPAPLDWTKGCAVTDRVIYEIAAMPQLIALLRPLLGADIVLWGASVTRRRPGSKHPWHADLEGVAANGRVISVWLGLQNAGTLSGLRLVTGSHRFGRSVQEIVAELQEPREHLTDVRVAKLAQSIDASARIVQPTIADGQILLFDSRIWHAGFNEGATATRTALLLQYAAADTRIPMPAADGYDWPFRFVLSPRVPAILISGRDRRAINRLVPPPPPRAKETAMITTIARTIAMPLGEDAEKRWRAYPQFRGPTRTLGGMSCHISVLSAGHHPHPPHIHAEEELLIVLDGEVEIELANDAAGQGSRHVTLRPGMFSYYPATQHHTIHNIGANPATYLMFKWHAGVAGVDEPLGASIFEYDPRGLTTNAKGETRPMMQKLLFQQATHCLGRLHAHLTTLQPGGGYEPHVDAYDVAILLLSGEVETLGERVKPLGLIYYSAGEPHGMRNVGTSPATYLVFEFHSPAALELKEQARLRARADRLAQEAREAERQRRKLEKQRRKRGPLGLARRIVKAIRRLARGRRPHAR